MADTLTGGPAPAAAIPRSPEVSRWLYDQTPIPETRRFLEMDRCEAHYATKQYSHLEYDWWGLSADQMETISPSVQVPRGFEQPAMAVSVRQKRPTAPYHLCRAIVDRFTGLLFSEGRKPDVFVENDADTEDMMRAVMHQCRFWPTMRQARTVGGAVGTVCITAHLRDGKYALEVHNGKMLTVLWKDRRNLTPRGILKQYKYVREMPSRDADTGAPTVKNVTFLSRRIITEHEDIVFKPVELRDGQVPEMEVADHVVHNLGFFPGVWIQNMPVLDDDDGDPDCEGAWQTFDTIDRLISQANKGTLLNMDPTLKLKVDPKVIELGGGVRKGSDNSLNVGVLGDAGYLEITGGGIATAMELIKDLRQNALDVTACVLVDPEQASGAAQSAKAIEYVYEPMLQKADILRSQYGDLGIIPLTEILIKLTKWAQDQGKSVQLPKKTTKFEPGPSAHAGARPVTHSVDHELGPGGHIKLQWPPYFTPTEQDKQLAVNTVVAAMTGGIIDEETAVKVGAQLYKVKEPLQMHRKIKEQQDADDEKAFAGLGDGGVPPVAVGDPKPGQPQDGNPNDKDPIQKPGQPPAIVPAKVKPTPPAGAGGKP